MPRDFEVWRDRLTAAKRTWHNKGLLGTSAQSSMRMLMDYYRSEQWGQMLNWGGLRESDLRIVNKIFPTANAQQAEIAARNPRTQYFARAPEWQQTAPAVKAYHDYLIREQNHIRQLNAAFRDHQFGPFGVVRHGYTPSDEIWSDPAQRRRRINFYRPAQGDRPWIRRVAPWNVLLDPFCEAFHMDGGMKWCAFRDVMSVSEIRANPNMVAREKLKDFSGNISPEWMELQDPALRDSPDPDARKWVEVWTVYEATERTWFQLTLDGIDEWLRAPADWPIPWEWLPVNVFTVNEQMDTPFALSLLEDLLPLQQELNQIRTAIHQAVLRTRRINIASKAAFPDTNEDGIRLANGEMAEWFFAEGSNVSQAVQTIQSGGLPQELLQHLAVVEEDMRESAGQSKMGRAQRINVESATEANFVQGGQDVQQGRIEDRFTTFVREVEQTFMQGSRFLAGTFGTRDHVMVLGERDGVKVQEWAEVTEHELHGEYEFEIEAGSTRRRDMGREAQLALIDFNTAAAIPEIANVPYFWLLYLEARGIDPVLGMLPGAFQQAALERASNVAGRLGGIVEPQGPQPIDANVIALAGQNRGGGASGRPQ